MSHDLLKVLHFYLPPNPFLVLESSKATAAFQKPTLCYHAGFHDLLLEPIANSILSEMRHETSSGRILIEALARSVAARLLHSYSSISIKRPAPGATPNRLVERKLRQVLDFIETHIADTSPLSSSLAAHLVKGGPYRFAPAQAIPDLQGSLCLAQRSGKT